MSPGHDINCDLGEGEQIEKTTALMQCLGSANIACGGHAGDRDTFLRCLDLARTCRVRPGAHPGLVDKTNFGRADISLDPPSFSQMLIDQVEWASSLSASATFPLCHIKLHGSLYHLVETSPEIRHVYIELVKKHWPKMVIFARANGKAVEAARAAGLKVWPEAFLDRGYMADGSLVPRHQPGALILDSSELETRLELLVQTGEIVARDSTRLNLNARTFCIHSDSSHSVEFARLAQKYLMGSPEGATQPE